MLIAATVAILLYAYSGVAWLRGWPWPHCSLASAAMAIAIHIALTVDHGYSDGAINFSFISVSNMIAVCITLISLGISFFLPVQKLAAPLFLLAAVNIVMSFFGTNMVTTTLSPNIAMHVFPSIVAYSLFSLAAALGCLLWLQHSALKQHRLSAVMADLPPIVVMEQMLISIILIAYILLSTAIISGFITIDDFLGQKLAHKTVFSILAWLTYSGLLYAHFATGVGGTRLIKTTIGGFIFLMLGFFGTKLVVELLV